MSTPFAIEPGAEGPTYAGPHGPIAIPADPSPTATRLRTPAGDAALEWGMLSDDRAAMERGVPASIGGRELVLRRAGKALRLTEAGGGEVALATRGRRGRVSVERPDGTPVAWFSPAKLAGEVEDGAGADEVAFLVLLIASNAASQLERRVPLPFLPFTIMAAAT